MFDFLFSFSFFDRFEVCVLCRMSEGSYFGAGRTGLSGRPCHPRSITAFQDSASWYSLVTGVGVVELRVHLLFSLPLTFLVRVLETIIMLGF